jgi:biopolymer transport protein ExbB/TolQ
MLQGRLSRLSHGLAAGLGLALWIACAFELASLAIHGFQGNLNSDGVLGRLLTQPTWADRAAPLAVLSVFAWILLQVMIHAIRIARESAALPQFKTWAPDALGKLSETLRTGQRARLALKHLQSSPGKLLEALPAAGALDAVAFENSYTLLRTCVWTLPVLGFIGTAWGMAHAIAGFSESLQVAAGSGREVQIELLTNRLGQLVIPGLASAFTITMLALGTSIIAHFWTTTLQSWDQDVLLDLDKTCAERLAELSPASEDPLVHVTRGLIQLTAQITLLLNRLDFQSAAESLDIAAESLKSSAGEHATAAQQMHKAASEIQAAARAPYYVAITREKAS